MLHAALLLAFVQLAGMPAIDLPAPPSVAVEILTSQQFLAITTRAPAEQVAPAEPVSLPPALPEAEPKPMIRAARLYSAATLADPKSREARQALPLLIAAERMEQLCNIEAMDQLTAFSDDIRPDRLVAYAMAATRISGDTILADGAAFRSQRRWFNLRYRCELTVERDKVAAFDFLVGDAVPKSEWDDHDISVID